MPAISVPLSVHALDKLRLLAETFAYELEREMRIRSAGGPSLPQEWVAHLEHERQEILDKIDQSKYDGLDELEESVSHSNKIQIATLHPPMLCTVPPTTVPRVPPSSQSNITQAGSDSAQASGLPVNLSTNNVSSPGEQKGFCYRPALRENEGKYAGFDVAPFVWLTDFYS
jgi:hypothetical protein